MTELRVRRRARDQVRAIAGHLERERPGYGALFLDAVEDAFRLIAEMPVSFPVVRERPDVRRGVLGRPFAKFVVYFTTNERSSTVLAVLHGARHPETWTR